MMRFAAAAIVFEERSSHPLADSDARVVILLLLLLLFLFLLLEEV